MESIKGKFRNLDFVVWKDSTYPIFYWIWGNYGGQVESVASCWESIRRAASDWSRNSDGNWIHSREEIK